jgi:hypothetical protein
MDRRLHIPKYFVYFRFLRGFKTAQNNTVSVVASNGYAGTNVEYGNPRVKYYSGGEYCCDGES